MTDELERLKGAYATTLPATKGQTPQPTGGVTASYDEKLRRLGRRWTGLLNTVGPAERYTTASEVDMAIVAALVKRNFTDGEIWEVLRGSPRYADRVERKGQRHTDDLYGKEIAKARGLVVPFPPDPPRSNPTTPPQRRHIDAPPPTPPRPPAFTVVTPADSFITRYVDYASQRTDAPPEAHELMAVGALSTLAGSSPRIPIATAVHGWQLNLWTLYIVNSTVGRKSTVVNFITDILVEVIGKAALIQWEMSPQGFIQALMARNGEPAAFVRDEYSGLMQQMNRGGHMAGMLQTLIRAYDGGTLENRRTKKKNEASGEMEADTDRVENPYLTKLCASTRDSFIQRATIDNVLDGFLARFIIVTGHAEARRLVKMPPALVHARVRLIQHAQDFHARANGIADMGITDAVLDAQWETEQAWIREADASDYPDALAASFKRLSESVLKTAALLAIDADTITVDVEHYRTALAMGERWKHSTRGLIETLGRTEFQRHCDDVMASVERHPDGIKLGELYQHHRRLRKRDFDEVLAALELQERIDRIEADQDGPGRKAVLLLPVSAAPESTGEQSLE